MVTEKKRARSANAMEIDSEGGFEKPKKPTKKQETKEEEDYEEEPEDESDEEEEEEEEEEEDEEEEEKEKRPQIYAEPSGTRCSERLAKKRTLASRERHSEDSPLYSRPRGNSHAYAQSEASGSCQKKRGASRRGQFFPSNAHVSGRFEKFKRIAAHLNQIAPQAIYMSSLDKERVQRHFQYLYRVTLTLDLLLHSGISKALQRFIASGACHELQRLAIELDKKWKNFVLDCFFGGDPALDEIDSTVVPSRKPPARDERQNEDSFMSFEREALSLEIASDGSTPKRQAADPKREVDA